MALTVELLKQLIAALPPTEDTEAALNFLKRPDLPPTGERSSCFPTEHSLRIYKRRQESTTRAGITTYGFPSLLLALEKLYPSEPLTRTVFKTNEWLGVFWSEQADQLIGFVLVKRRTPQQEQERLDWFRQNLT